MNLKPVKKNTIYLLGLAVLVSACRPEYILPSSASEPPSNWVAPNYNDPGLEYRGQISFESSSAVDLCTQRAARIEVSGVFYRSTEYFNGQVSFSTVPGKVKSTIPCSAFQFSIVQQVREKSTDRFGTVSYDWTNVSSGSGSMDGSCNLTITPNLNIRGPDYRLVINPIVAPGGATASFINALTVSCP